MKSKFLALLLFSSFFSASTFAITSDETNQQKNKIGQTQNSNQQGDGTVIAWLIVLNKNEIAASKEASKRNLKPEVKKYAVNLNKEHSKNLQETLNLSRKNGHKPIENEDTKTLKQKGKEELSTLKPLDDKQFQIVFIDTMVNDHTDALNKIDQDLNTTTDPQLKKHLQKTRTKVAEHLEKAKNIQNQLKSNP